MDREHFDAVVVGSGFGGSVCAARLAEAGKSVCVFERGKRYPPGSFPRSPRELAKSFWDPSNGGHGLYQFWSFSGIESLVASGFGGGSLVFSNVLIRKKEKTFVIENPEGKGFEPWPISREDLDPHYDRVEAVLRPQPYPAIYAPYDSTPKMLAFREAAERVGLKPFEPPLNVTFANVGRPPVPGEPVLDASGQFDRNPYGRPRSTCQLLGECNMGCNVGAKNSLDYNYLYAAELAGAVARTRCEVRSIEPTAGGFLCHYVEHLPDHEGSRVDTQSLPIHTVSCRQLVLTAGVFGTTYLLLRNRNSHLPRLSSALGTRFCGNGDLVGFMHSPTKPRDFNPTFGPAITTAAAVSLSLDGQQTEGLYVEEANLPLFFAWVLETANTPVELGRVIRLLGRRIRAAVTHNPKSDLSGEVSALIGKARNTSGILVLLAIGLDTPDGVMNLRGKWLEVDWRPARSRAYFAKARQVMQQMAAAMGCQFTVYPTWYLPDYVTVHSLGGSPMGRSVDDGVVDSFGRVFNYPGLYIADGSAMPGPVGVNPSLTIAAFADRVAEAMISDTLS
jgi:cholesterol oxidase